VAMKHLMLLKNRSDEVFNASSPHFIASSLSTQYKFMQKSPLNSAGLLVTCKSKDEKLFWLCYENNGNIRIFIEIDNANHHFITSMR
jgi:hypothetical protein